MLSQLRHFGHLNTQIISQSLSHLKEQISMLNPSELALFTMIYTSSESRNTMARDPNFDEKLEFVLSKHIEHFSAEEFAMICNSLVATDSQFNDSTLEFTSLLKEAVPYGISWFKDNAFSLSDLPSVVVAFSQVASEVEEGKNLQDAIENCI